MKPEDKYVAVKVPKDLHGFLKGKAKENDRNTIGNHRKTIGPPKENHGKTIRKTIGKPQEYHGKTIGKPKENHRKTKGKTTGKPKENHRRTKGKPKENHRKTIGLGPPMV